MNTTEKINYFNTDHTLDFIELDRISGSQTMTIQINDELEKALEELESLQNQISSEESESLMQLCKATVIDSITSQFGLASMFIAAKDGGSVTTTHNFKQGITSTDTDKAKHDAFKTNNDGSKKWGDVRKDGGYDDGFKERRKRTFQDQDVVIDAYTGKPLPKDGRAHIDHIVSAKEIESKAENHLFMSAEARAKMATSDANTAFTEGSANQSKGDKSMSEWLETERKTGETNAEKYGIDEEAALKKDKAARSYIQKEVTVAAAKKYTKELFVTGGKDAVNMAAYSAIGLVLRDLTQAIFEEIHVTFRRRGKESFKEIFVRFKERIGIVLEQIKAKWKDILKGSLEAAIIAFLSNIVVFAINLFATTLKKMVTMIRAGFVSLCQAVKILANPPTDMDPDEVNYQALKILTAGLIGAASLGLYAGIENLLLSVPGLQPIMMFPVPFPGEEPRTVSDILAATLTGMSAGLLTTVALFLMDSIRDSEKREKLQIQLVSQSGVVVHYQISQTWCVLDDAYSFLETKVEEGIKICNDTKDELGKIHQETSSVVDEYSRSVSNFRERMKTLGKEN